MSNQVAFLYHDVFDGRGFSRIKESWRRYRLARNLFRELHLLPPEELAIAEPASDYPIAEIVPSPPTDEEILRVHTVAHLQHVRDADARGTGFLDYGDTPAWPGVFRRASLAVGGTILAARLVASGQYRRAFNPAGGLHHAQHDRAGGFCVFNDAGILLEELKRRGLPRIAYVDIDAHHGDGVYYDFEADPCVLVADIHEDGRSLYPGTGSHEEQGLGAASGSKLNIPLPAGASDPEFLAAWAEVEDFVREARPEIILLQAGADSIAGDPLTHLAFTPAAHRHATRRLCRIAAEYAQGRVLVMGGGGYKLENIGATWSGVLEELLADC